MTPMSLWAQVHAYARQWYTLERQGQLFDPSRVRWSQAAAAQVAEDEDHLRGLVKRHCL